MRIELVKLNDSFIKVNAERSILSEMGDYFTFSVPGAHFTPAYRNKMWDGKKRLLNLMDQTIPFGLLPYIKKFSADNEYELDCGNLDLENEFSIVEAEEYFRGLNPCSNGKPIEPRDYQISAFRTAIQRKRVILVSPTASGKSLVIYALVRWYTQVGMDVLIVVPTTSLVEQMYGDFRDYSNNTWPVDDYCHRVYSGKDKNTKKQVVITTWQSIFNLKREWFQRFTAVIGDEAHGFQANSLTKVMNKLTKAKYRVGTTGTLQDTKVHKLVLEGHFGVATEVVTTRELIDSKSIADIKILCLLLHYPTEDCKKVQKLTYQEEIEFIVQNPKRMKFLRNLALSLDGNTLILFNLVEKHGKQIYKELLSKAENKVPIFLVHGKVLTEDRETIRHNIEGLDKSITVASAGVFSQGINIKRLHNVIFATPVKSPIRNRQSIGRGLRLGSDKVMVSLYDIVDVLQYKTRKNYALEHFLVRANIYDTEQLNYKQYPIELK
jgi:superfamily II DNA or RNA helicase